MRSRRILLICNLCLFMLTSSLLLTWWVNQRKISPERNKIRTDCVNTSFEQAPKSKVKPTDLPAVDVVARSLKNEKLYKTGGDFHQYFDKAGEDTFDRPLSIYDEKDEEMLKSLFPKGDEKQPITSQTGRIQKQLKLKLKYAEQKLIYVSFYDNHLTPHSVQSNQCLVDNCRVTTDKRQIKNADAVLFRSLLKRIHRPKQRPNQLWIFHQLESQATIKFVSTHHELINWTATFRSDSTLQTPYGKFVTHNHITKLPAADGRRNYAKGKTKLVAWFVSNCGGHNGRMAYVDELQKYTHVDVYGFCGPLTCKKGNEAYKCTKMLKDDYKFYLAFENSNCRDYITEKFFQNALQ